MDLLRNFSRCLLSCCLGLLSLISHGQTITDYIYPIDQVEEDYGGDGVDWLLNRARDKTFLLFGEQHGISEIPYFVAYCYRELQSAGFQHLILETDPTTGRYITDMGVADFVDTYPHSLAFDYDGELELIETAIRLHPGRQVIWGVDQPVTAIHPFQLLAQLAKRAGTKRICRGLFLKATLKAGKYLREDHQKDFDRLQRLFQQEDNRPALEIVDQLIISNDIYLAYFAGQRGEIPLQTSDAQRENYMKVNFDHFLTQAPATGKAILKLGGAHTTYGIGPNGIPTLGGYVSECAQEAGEAILSIGISNFDPGEAFPSDSLFSDHGAMLIDHLAIRSELDSHQLSALPESFRQTLDYFDATIFFNQADRATKSVISGPTRRFRNRAILILALGLLPLLINLSLLVPTLRLRLLARFRRSRQQYPLGPVTGMLLFSLLIDALLLVQLASLAFSQPLQNTAPVSPGLSLILFVFLLLTIGWQVYRFFLFSRQRAWNVGLRRHLGLVVICNLLLVGYMYYWNIGGMLG